MSDFDFDLESLWEGLLSRDPQQIKNSYQTLSTQEGQSVLAHLKRMVTEPGWNAEQRVSAKAALDVLQDL
jgi:hypothetical protein